MATKVRKQVYIEPHQDETLKRLARETGISEAELIRRAIDRYAQSLQAASRDLAAWEKERDFITHLIQQDPVPGRRTWQREELYGQFVTPLIDDFQADAFG